MRSHVVTAPEAARLAGVTYRQLDYWARCGWVVPTAPPLSGRRRLYCPADVVRLALLGHLGRSGVDVRGVSAQVGELELTPAADVVVICEAPTTLTVVPGTELRPIMGQPGARVLFDPAPVWARIFEQHQSATEPGDAHLDQRRSA